MKIVLRTGASLCQVIWILQRVWFCFTALGIGSADIVSGMIEDEKRHSEQYLEKLKEMMQAKGVSRTYYKMIYIQYLKQTQHSSFSLGKYHNSHIISLKYVCEVIEVWNVPAFLYSLSKHRQIRFHNLFA